MGAMKTFTTAWQAFRHERGMSRIVLLNFMANLVAMFLIRLTGVNIPYLALHPLASGLANRVLQYRFLIPFLIVTFVVQPFILSATLNSLNEARNDRFVIEGYFQNGVRYFGKSLIFKIITYLVFIVSTFISLVIVEVFSRAFQLFGLVIAIALVLPGWIYSAEFLLALMVKYVSGAEENGSLGISISKSLLFANKNYFSMIALLLIVFCAQTAALILNVILGGIPVIGIFLSVLVTVAISLLSLLTVMIFILSNKPSAQGVSVLRQS